MKNNILVSIIVPVYNTEEYIKECIDSLINQTYKNIEIILVNDGSTDDTVNIIKSYKDSRIKLLNQNNSGPNIARKKGLAKAKGDYIMFVDSDDYIDLDTISKLLDYIKDYDIVKFNLIFEPTKKIKLDFKTKELSNNDIYNYLIKTKNLNNLCATLYRKSILDLKYFDNKYKYCEDFYINMNVMPNKKIFILNECFYHYRLNYNSTTQNIDVNNIMSNIQDMLDVNKQLFDYLEIWNINDNKTKRELALTIYENIIQYSYGLFKSNIKKDELLNYLTSLYNNDLFEYIRKIITVNDIKKFLSKKSIYTNVKNRSNMINIYNKKYKRLWINHYLMKIKNMLK